MLQNSKALRRVGAGAVTVTIAGLIPVFASTAALASAVSNATLSISPTTAGATGTATVTFVATTAIAGAQNTGNSDTITVAPQGGEMLSTNTADYSVNGNSVAGVTAANGAEVITLANGTSAAAGSTVTVVIGGNTNPVAGSQVSFNVNTDKDTEVRGTNQVAIGTSSTNTTPTVTQVSPVKIPTSGVPVQITGTNFNTTASGNTVRFVPQSGSAGTTVTLTGQTTTVSTQLVVTPTTLVDQGSYDVEVSTNGSVFSTVSSVDVLGARTGLSFIPLVPGRALDTRIGFGGPRSQIQPGTSITVPVGSILPTGTTGVTAVAVNLTEVNAKGAGYAVVSNGTPAANTSTVNYDPNTDATANFAIVPASNATNPVITLTNATGGSAADFTLDVTGYFTSAQLTGGTTGRVVDTRPGTANVGPSAGPLGSRTNYSVTLTPPANATAVVLNATSIHPSSAGNLRIFPQTGANASLTTPTNTSAVQYVPNQDAAAAVVVPLGTNNTIDLYNDSPNSANVAIDVVGYLGTGNGLTTSGPNRAIDTRNGTAVTPGTPTQVNVANVAANNGGSVSPTLVSAALVSVTAIQPTSGGNLAAYPDGAAAPNTANATGNQSSTVNYYANQTRENFTIVGVRNGILDLSAAGVPANAVVDVVGYF